jgi:hemoglobin/transferrin/lactoferrin receptor protein
LSGDVNLQYATPEGMPKWVTLNINSQFNLDKNLNLQLGIENMLDKN